MPIVQPFTPTQRLKVLTAQLAGASQQASCFPVLEAGPCIGESSFLSPDKEGAVYARQPLKIVFADSSAADERYGGSGDIVMLEGELLCPPGQKSDTVLVFMHPSGIMTALPAIIGFATSGLHVVAMTCRYPNNDTTLIMEKVCMDLGATLTYLRGKLGYTKVVLCGWSGGGSLMSMYQSQAENPTIRQTPAGDTIDMQGLPKADALMILAAHSSRARILSEWIDPAVLDERNPHTRRDPKLDIFGKGPDTPRPPFSPEFFAHYREAQRARVRRITAWVKEQLRIIKAEETADDWREGRRDMVFNVHCTQADIARIDIALEQNQRPVEDLLALKRENHSPVGLARCATLRAWLSQWSLDDSNADALEALKHVSVPVFVLQNGADHLVPPSHNKGMFSAVAHDNKTYYVADGATHYYFGQRKLLREVISTCSTWLEKQGLLAAQPVVEPPLSLAELQTRYTAGQLPERLEICGVNHLAMVCSDMNRTIKFVCEKLGMPLIKTIEIGDGQGQHFFFDSGNGSALAYFWWPGSRPAAPGISSPQTIMDSEEASHTAIGSMNHVAWNVAAGRLKEYRKLLKERGAEPSAILFHADIPGGYVGKLDDSVIFSSFYFRGPDGELFEFTEQHRDFTPKRDILHVPKTSADLTRR